MTQLEALKAAFDRGESLTVLEALQRFGVMALSQRCTDLRREGYPIMSSWVQLGNGKKIKRYAKGLYGDGIHDDTVVLQRMTDAGAVFWK